MKARSCVLGLALAIAAVATALHPRAAEASGRSRPVIISGIVNLNDATAAQLELLPGIGEKAAARIIEHRSKKPFSRPEELVKVKGFGKKRFDGLKPHLAVAGPTTLHVQRHGGSQGRVARRR